VTEPQAAHPRHHPFDGTQARKGYALNKMCYSFNHAENRQAFLRDEDAYCAKYGLNAQQREAIRARNVLQLIAPAATPTTWPSSPASSAWTCRTSARSRPA
jgi:protocatechuate 4,5-dioxygenase alpha subunit